MRIVDRRPRLARLVTENTAPARPWQQPAAWVADRLVQRRVDRRQAAPADVLVVSVGNLRVGGTGKTPVVARLARDLAAMGISGGVVTRGYRSPDPRPRVVQPDDAAAGDEARMLARTLAGVGWPVVQAPDRTRGVAQLRQCELTPGSVIILEDAHQSAGSGRHLDIVILDRWADHGGEIVAETGPVLPFGPYRESVQGAHRAGVWLLESDLPDGRSAPGKIQLAGFRRRTVVPAVAAGARIGLVSGLARPERFEAAVMRELAAAPLVSVRLADHAGYDQRTLALLADLSAELGLQGWLTTAKDHVKLADRWTLTQDLAVAGLEVEWTTRPTLPELVAERRQALAGAGV